MQFVKDDDMPLWENLISPQELRETPKDPQASFSSVKLNVHDQMVSMEELKCANHYRQKRTQRLVSCLS